MFEPEFYSIENEIKSLQGSNESNKFYKMRFLASPRRRGNYVTSISISVEAAIESEKKKYTFFGYVLGPCFYQTNQPSTF